MSRREKRVADAPAKPEPLWNDHASAGGRGKHLGVKWTVFVLIALVCVGLFLRAMRPVNQTIVNEAQQGGTSSVSALAAAFASDWYTWDANRSQDRTDRLSAYNPDLTNVGWNTAGVQKVTASQPFSEEDLGGGQYRVVVRISVDTTPAPFYVDVLVFKAKDGALAVESVPSIVPAPALATPKAPSPETHLEPDTKVTEAIRSQLALFFTAWAAGDSSLDQFVYQGAEIAPIGGGLSFGSLTTVTVPALDKDADKSHRTVQAKVTWKWPGSDATSAAAYSVDLVQASGKWFIAAVKGAVPDDKVIPTKAATVAPEPTSSPSASTSSQPSAPSSGTPVTSLNPDSPTGQQGD